MREQRAKYRGVCQTKDCLIWRVDKAISESFRVLQMYRKSHLQNPEKANSFDCLVYWKITMQFQDQFPNSDLEKDYIEKWYFSNNKSKYIGFPNVFMRRGIYKLCTVIKPWQRAQLDLIFINNLAIYMNYVKSPLQCLLVKKTNGAPLKATIKKYD